MKYLLLLTSLLSSYAYVMEDDDLGVHYGARNTIGDKKYDAQTQVRSAFENAKAAMRAGIDCYAANDVKSCFANCQMDAALTTDEYNELMNYLPILKSAQQIKILLKHWEQRSKSNRETDSEEAKIDAKEQDIRTQLVMLTLKDNPIFKQISLSAKKK